MPEESDEDQEEAEAIRFLSQLPFELLQYLLEQSEEKRLDVVRSDVAEQRKILGKLSVDGLSEFARSRLGVLDPRSDRYRKAIALQEHDSTVAGTPESAPDANLIASQEPATASCSPEGEQAGQTATDWADIEISFLSDERVQIRNGKILETRNYSELGFTDRRNGKPNQAWIILRALAEKCGTIPDDRRTCPEWLKVEKRIQEIRKVLRCHFSISADPIPFVGGTGYQACFKIGCSRSFHT